ncbi:MAG: hypothetical protein KKB39_01315 [Nanoarchaeota archaeon]|nr:hypothetical protein [Nanoarchaeota archaeon]
MESCCELGAILNKEKDRVLFESDNFFIAPTIGPMGIEGYLLIISKKCYSGLGQIPENQYNELEGLITMARGIIKDNYNQDIQIFEHGPRVCGFKGGK